MNAADVLFVTVVVVVFAGAMVGFVRWGRRVPATPHNRYRGGTSMSDDYWAEEDRITFLLSDREKWNDHLANEVSIHILAVPRWLRGPYLRRVARLRQGASE